VDDAVFDSQREGIQPIVYLPVAQSVGIGPSGLTEISVGVRPAVGSPMQLARSVGAAITGVDPGLSFTFRLLTEHVDASVRQERIVAMVSGVFGGLALLIAAVGLYGVTSYTVNRRFTEIVIRTALGAQRSHVLRLVLEQSLALTAVGIGLGVAGASAVTRYLRGMLFGLTPLDPGTSLASRCCSPSLPGWRHRSRRTAPPDSTRSSRFAPTDSMEAPHRCLRDLVAPSAKLSATSRLRRSSGANR
jgi:putative ABC transport system permease protein